MAIPKVAAPSQREYLLKVQNFIKMDLVHTVATRRPTADSGPTDQKDHTPLPKDDVIFEGFMRTNNDIN
jgi:hypothetical protein